MLWLLFALLAAAMWGATNLIDATLLEQEEQSPLVLTIITGIFGTIPIFLLPFVSPIEHTSLAFIAILTGMLGLFIYWPYFRAMEKTHTANVILLWNLTPILVVLFSYLFLNEVLSLVEYVAFCLLLGSSFLTNYDPRAPQTYSKSAVVWMLLASVTSAIEIVLLGFIFSQTKVGTGLAWISVGTMLATFFPILLFGSLRQQLKQAFNSRTRRQRIFANESLDVMAHVLRSAAVHLGPTSLVSAIGGLQPLFVLLLQPFAKTKHQPPSRTLAMIAIAFGVIGLGLLARDL